MYRRHYTNEEISKIILVIQQNPKGEYNNERFWRSVINQYGKAYFNGRTAAGLRQKWRTLMNSIKLDDLINEDKEFFNEVMKHKELLKRNNGKEEYLMETLSEKDWDNDDGAMDKKQSLNGDKTLSHIDTGASSTEENLPMEEDQSPKISCLSEETKNNHPDEILKTEGLVFSRDQVLKLHHQFNGYVPIIENYLLGDSTDRWNELEDITLIQGKNTEMYKYLVSYKGEAEIRNRRKYLGLE